MGDANAKVGEDSTGYEEVMGNHSLGVMNDNGERIILSNLPINIFVVCRNQVKRCLQMRNMFHLKTRKAHLELKLKQREL